MPRRRLLTDAQRASLLALPTREVALIRHYTLAGDDLALVATRRHPETKLGLALQLCALRYPGRLLRPGELIPTEPLAFIAEQAGVPPDSLAGFARRGPTRYEQLRLLYRTYGFQELTRPHRAELAAWLLPIARETTAGLPLVEALLGEMRRRRIVVPGISVVERLAAAVLHDAERQVWATIAGRLDDIQTRRLEMLLEEREHERQSCFSWLREPIGASAMGAILDRLDAARRLALDPAIISGIPVARLRQLVREGSRLTAQGLRQMTPPRRRAILAATVLELETDLTDAALNALGASLSRALATARRKREAEILDSAGASDAAIRRLTALGDALLEARAAGGKLEDAVQRAVGWDQLGSTVARAKGLFRDDPNDRPALLMAEQASVRRLGPRLLASLRFHGAPTCKPLLDALGLLRDAKGGRGRSMPDDAPLAFVTVSWRRHVRRDDGSLDRRAYELCALSELNDRLRAGDVWVDGSRSYQASDSLLIPYTAFADLDAQGTPSPSVPIEADAWIGAQRHLLDRELSTTARRLARAPAPDSQRLIRALLGPSPEKENAVEATMAARLDAMLPPVRLTDLLEEVDRWTGFTALFAHVQTGRPPADRRAFLAALIAEATNLGLARMARVCAAASRKQLVWTATWHMREETFALALARLVEAQDKTPLAAVFGTGTTSSSDGQHFFLGGPGEASGTVNPHRGREPGITLYTHVNNRYAPFHVKVIAATAGEAAHVLDGLLGTAAGRRVQVHHTDGGGVSDHVFGLCVLLGYDFVPRIPNLDDRRRYAFEPRARYGRLAPLLGERLDAGLIRDQWGELRRLAASLRAGTVPASLILRRLGAYPRQNMLAAGLREVGRVARTLFTLRWIADPELRRRVTAELNKGEARNTLARAVCIHRLGRFRDRSLENQAGRASALILVTAAVVLWNTVYLGRAIDVLRARGERIGADDLATLSPLGWEHVNITGDYIWEDQTRLDPDGFRQLVMPA
jgi:TnpA family transposase